MHNYFFTKNGIDYHRVTKALARKAFNVGLSVVFCPCNLRPGGMWHPDVELNNSDGRDFEQALTYFDWYNCTDTETGKYAAFFLPFSTGYHIEFTDGSNPYVSFSKDIEKIIAELLKWNKGYNLELVDSNKCGVYFRASQKIREV